MKLKLCQYKVHQLVLISSYSLTSLPIFSQQQNKSAELVVPQNVDMQYINLVPAQSSKHCWVRLLQSQKQNYK